MSVLQYTFWAALFLLLYIYFGYPLLACLISTWRRRVVRKGHHEPSVSILTAAHNEASDIAQSIKNKIELDYPSDRFEIIVISDASTDDTDEIVKDCAKRFPNRLKLLRQNPQQGKTAALNLAARQARGDVLVFADANSIYDRRALKQLVTNFNDPEVGYATGKMVYVAQDSGVIGEGYTAYMGYENFLRACESRLGSVVGVDGGIDAIRKELFVEMRPNQLPDFVLPLSVVRRGYRVVYEPEALLREQALGRPSDEYAMRVRVALRGLWAVSDMKSLLNPFRYRLYSWQLLSHKVLRYTAFLLLPPILILNVLLVEAGTIYKICLVGQCFFYLLAGVAPLLPSGRWKVPFARLPYYFLLLNLASAHAFWKFLKGETQSLWQPRLG
jgi:cellulose synthase/poly-beta-1,6-N-acetylglucosamine synthase-like glycosyltransferase